jgi:hypothetical protein
MSLTALTKAAASTPADTLSTATPTCKELSDLASGDGDGYYGPCSIQRLPTGVLLIARSGQLKSSPGVMAQAILIRPDGGQAHGQGREVPADGR